jgi:hypothetical protein
MKLIAFTLVLDGMPWITKHLDILRATNLDWKWIIVHGAAMNNGSTQWCQPQEPRLSTDGTTEYLRSIKDDRVLLMECDRWNSKDQMCNAAVSEIKEHCVLMEIDSDEIWTPSQIEKIVEQFDSNSCGMTPCSVHNRTGYPVDAMQFKCRYFVGEGLITKGEHCYGDMDYEWWRTWRYYPGTKFESHEPPVIPLGTGLKFPKSATSEMGLVFDHYAYATEAQVAYKEKFYGYKGLLEGWKRLQEQRMFPVFLRDFFPHVTDNALVVRA